MLRSLYAILVGWFAGLALTLALIAIDRFAISGVVLMFPVLGLVHWVLVAVGLLTTQGIGGYVAARVKGSNELEHAAVVGAISLTIAFASQVNQPEALQSWGLVFAVGAVSLVSAVAGGGIARRRRRRLSDEQRAGVRTEFGRSRRAG
jgi:hypothetical protein